MNLKIKFDQEADVFELVPAVKTLDRCMSVLDQQFEAKLKEAFDLAKSAGRELDVTFTSESAPEPQPQTSEEWLRPAGFRATESSL